MFFNRHWKIIKRCDNPTRYLWEVWRRKGLFKWVLVYTCDEYTAARFYINEHSVKVHYYDSGGDLAL